MASKPKEAVSVPALDSNDGPLAIALSTPTCGLVMPIADFDGCLARHWSEVRLIIEEAISTLDSPKFQVKMVSEDDSATLIHRSIVTNLYTSAIVVCDVSGRNPNVMLELGMRLAFSLPVVIIKDDATSFSFDTQVMEHIQYRRDLRYSDIGEFKRRLAQKVAATYAAYLRDPDSTSYMKTFGPIKVAKLTTEEVSGDSLTLRLFEELRDEVRSLRLQLLGGGKTIGEWKPQATQTKKTASQMERDAALAAALANPYKDNALISLLSRTNTVEAELKKRAMAALGRLREAEGGDDDQTSGAV